MAKSIKFSNDIYLDSSSIVHNKKKLNEILNTKDVYSTQEVKTNKLWVDNKSIYRKCIVFSSLASIKTGILKLDNLLKMECMLHQIGGGWRNLPWLFNELNSAWAGGLYYNEDTSTISFQVGENLGAIDKGILILEYTKITD